MAIKWLNIRSREVVVAETEPQITALWASSDHSPNITQGQDFGWRLAPEVVVEMRRIKQNEDLLLNIAKRYNRPLEDVGEPEILQYISDRTKASDAPLADQSDYTDEYQQEIRRLEIANERTGAEILSNPMTTVTTTESLADMERRAELEERIAKAKREQAAVDNGTQTSAETVTTTTTEVPKVTTTTTKKQ